MYDNARSAIGLLGTGLALAPNRLPTPSALFDRPYGRYAPEPPSPYFSRTDSAGLGSREVRRGTVAGLGSRLRTLLAIPGLGSRVFRPVPNVEGFVIPVSLFLRDVRPLKDAVVRFGSAGLGSRERTLLALLLSVGIFLASAGLGSRDRTPVPVLIVIELVNRCF